MSSGCYTEEKKCFLPKLKTAGHGNRKNFMGLDGHFTSKKIQVKGVRIVTFAPILVKK